MVNGSWRNIFYKKFGRFGRNAYFCIMNARRDKQKLQNNQLNKQLETTEKPNPENSQSIALEAGKFCLDIAKLVFGGVILAGIMQQGIDFNSLFLTGLFVVLLFVAFGF